MDTYQEAQDYLSKGVRGKKWYISLATVFAHLPEGDARIAFVQELIGDTHFGKAFLANYQPNASYRMNSDNGRTSLETELESYDAFVKSLNPDVDKMEAIATQLRQEMNGNSSETLLIHLFLCQVVRDLCQGKKHIIILNRAECLLKNGFAEEAFRALEYIDSDWIESKKDLIFEFFMGGFMKSWKGISIPISDYTDFIPKETLDRIADTSFDRFVDGINNSDDQSSDSTLEMLYNNARNLSQKGFGHHASQEIDNYIGQLWYEAGYTSEKNFDKNDVKKIWEYVKQKKHKEKQLEWKKKADMIVQFVKTGEIEDPDLLNEEDTELSDVLDDVLNNYPEEVQTDIFNRILDDEDKEKVKYIKDFIEENMEDVPFDIARGFAIDGSEPAIERMLTAISEAEITLPWDDPILFYKIRYEIENEFPEWRVDDDIIEYLDDDNPALDVVEFFAGVEEEYFHCYAARAYHTIGYSLKALETCVDSEDFVYDLSDEKKAEWFVEVLQGALETNEEEAKKIIRNIDIDEKTEEIIFEICSEKNPDLAKKLHELWEIEEIEDGIEQEDQPVQGHGKEMAPKQKNEKSLEQEPEKDEEVRELPEQERDEIVNPKQGAAEPPKQEPKKDKVDGTQEQKLKSWKKRADSIVRFIKTEETDNPKLLNAKLLDVLQNVLDKYPEDIQVDIFTQILYIEQGEKLESIERFIEENIDSVPFKLARDLALEGFEFAVDRIMSDWHNGEWWLGDDPILYFEITAIEITDDDVYARIKWYLDDGEWNDKPEILDYFSKVFYEEEDSIKVLKTYLKGEFLNNDTLKFRRLKKKPPLPSELLFLDALRAAFDTDGVKFEEIIRENEFVVEFKDMIFEYCLEEGWNDLATKLKEIWQMQGIKEPSEGEKEDSAEEGNNAKQEEKESQGQELKQEEETEEQEEKKEGQPVPKAVVNTNDANALFALYQEKGGIKILRKAAKLGHAEAQYQLGLHLLELHQDTPLWKKAIKAVKGTKTNKEKAMEWFKKAAKQGHADAKRMLKK